MPVVSVKKRELCAALGRDYDEEDFQKLCFDFGIELDDVLIEGEEEESGAGPAAGGGAADGAAGEVVWKIEIPANRYDLLCVEGIGSALRTFIGLAGIPSFRAVEPSTPLEMFVKSETKSIRPFVVCAVLRNMTFTQASYKSFIDLQDKLHHNVCRRRTLVSVGTHDLSTVRGPFTYEALPPSEINFVPLSQTRSFRADQLLDFYRTDPSVKHIKPFTDIIYSSPVYPVVYDSDRVVMSLPPIINGEHSKIVAGKTKDVFIEVTATDLTKAHIVLNTMVTMFAGYCERPCEVEQVRVTYEDGLTYLSPKLDGWPLVARVSEINSLLGLELTAAQIVGYCNRMQLSATAGTAGDTVEVIVPPTRTDILHECDIVEDVAIGYGFNNITKKIPRTHTAGRQLPINAFSDLLRAEMAQAGYDECLTMGLCSIEENFGMLRRPYGPQSAVVLENPKTEEFQIVRTMLLPGVLKTVASNKSTKVGDGLRLFEISDVVFLSDASDVGAVNERHVCAVYSGPTAGLEIIHGLVDRFMKLCDVRPIKELEVDAGWEALDDSVLVPRYRLELNSEPMYWEGRGIDVILDKPATDSAAATSVRLGHFGIIHPEVLGNYKLTLPTSSMELNVQALL